MVSVVSGLVVTLFGVRNVRGGFIVVILCAYAGVFACRTCFGHNCSVEMLEFKRCRCFRVKKFVIWVTRLVFKVEHLR